MAQRDDDCGLKGMQGLSGAQQDFEGKTINVDVDTIQSRDVVVPNIVIQPVKGMDLSFGLMPPDLGYAVLDRAGLGA